MAKTILVADDSKTMRRVVEITFEKSGFQVVSVGSGREALDRAPGLQPDIVLCDVGMPDGDGYTICTTLKQQATTGHIPVVLLGGGANAVDVGRATAAQADGHARKPFDPAELIHLVKQLTGVPVDGDRPLTFAAALARRQAPAPAPAAASPFSPPQVPPASADIPIASADIDVEEELVIEDVEMVEEGNFAAGPSLEPPTPPSELGPRPNVDVWSLADGSPPPLDDEPQELGSDALEVVEPLVSPFSAPAREIQDEEPTRDMRQSGTARVVDALAAAAAPRVADVVAPAAPGLSREELVALAREVIEQVAWEVVPELAETIIREELHRLVGD